MSITPFVFPDFSLGDSCPPKPNTEVKELFTLVKSADIGRYCFIRKLDRLMFAIFFTISTSIQVYI